MEKEQLKKYLDQIAYDIQKDEGEIGNEENNFSTENNDIPKRPPFTLSRLFKLFGAQTDSPYIFAVEKIHNLLGQYGKSGLDEKGKADIDALVSDLNKTAPEVGELIQEIFNDYGYELDMEIPREMGLIAHGAIAAWRVREIKNANLKRMKSTHEAIPEAREVSKDHWTEKVDSSTPQMGDMGVVK